VFVGRVDGTSEIIECCQLLPKISSGEVGIEGKHGALDDIAVAPFAFFEMPADKAADILDFILFQLLHLGKLRHGLPGTGGDGELLDEVLPSDLGVFPLRRFTAVRQGDRVFFHVALLVNP